MFELQIYKDKIVDMSWMSWTSAEYFETFSGLCEHMNTMTWDTAEQRLKLYGDV